MEILADGFIVLVDADRFAAIGKPLLAVYADGRGGIQNVRCLGQKKTVFLHKAVFGECPAGYVVDHINGNVLDNRLENLRLATLSQNARNAINGISGSSKYPGVSWHTKSNKWRVALSVGGKKQHIGYFKCELEAAKVAKRYSIIFHGEFSIYNRLHKEL